MSFLFSLITLLGSYQVVWQHTDIDVPLNASIYDYVDIPQAKLYIDGIYVNTPVTYIYNGVNRTFLSTVQTSYVKSYQIDYEAYFPNYDIKDDYSIFFNVIDEDPPVFIYIPEYEIDVGENLPDFLESVTYSDNYDDVSNIICVVDSHEVNTDVIGHYKIIYYLNDTSHNQSIAERYIDVVDRVSPKIDVVKPLIIDVHETKSILDDYIKVTDNYDLLVDVTYDDKEVDYDRLGTYILNVIAQDQSKNMTSKLFKIEIADHEAPHLVLTSSKTIDVFDIDALNHLDRYILSLSDNYDDENQLIISYEYDIDMNHLGTYHLIIDVMDSSGNTTSQSIDIKVVDLKGPIITLKEALVFQVFEVKPFINLYFNISDNYDPFESLTINIDEDIDMDKIGSYPVTLTVKDLSKNVSYYYAYVQVIDDIPPEINELNEIIITGFQQIDYTSYFSFSDNYDDVEDITFEFDDQVVDYQKKGTYDFIVYAKDLSQNISTYITQIYVLDIIAPKIELNKYDIFVDLNSKPFNFYENILSASDNYDLLTKDDVAIIYDIAYDKIGVYTVSYQLTDESLNQTNVYLSFVVDDFTKPLVTIDDIVVNQNDSIDFLSGIHVTDDSSYEIYYDSSYIDSSLIGTQYLTYVIMDERGNYQTYIRRFDILENQKTFDYWSFAPMGLVLILSMILSFYVYKKSHHF
ncbi:MAG: hypothetical protein AB7E61_07660 [Acholeplasmataceae bacterium]